MVLQKTKVTPFHFPSVQKYSSEGEKGVLLYDGDRCLGTIMGSHTI